MTPEQQAEYDALPWERLTYTEEMEREAFGYGESSGGSDNCIACGETLEPGDILFSKETTADYWHERHAPIQASGAPKDGWPRKFLEPSQAAKEHPLLWRKIGTLLPFLDEYNRAATVSLIVDTCPKCYERNGDMTHEDDS